MCISRSHAKGLCLPPHICRNMWTIWTKTEGSKSGHKKYHIWCLRSVQFHWRTCWFECISVNLSLSLSLSLMNLWVSFPTSLTCQLMIIMLLQLWSLNPGISSIRQTMDQAENVAALEEIGSVIIADAGLLSVTCFGSANHPPF